MKRNYIKRSFMLRSMFVLIAFISMSLLSSVAFAAENGDKTENQPQRQPQREISGTVIDMEGNALAGVLVQIKNTTSGAITDGQGKFITKATPRDTLVFSYLGFKDQEVLASRDVLAVQMEEDALQVDDVVVVGYGTARRSDLTGAIASIDADELSTQAPRSVEDLLRGNSAGLTIGMSTSAKGTSDNLQIRGNTTLSAGSDPLIVLDGAIYEGSISDINPMDIATLDILKDASSAAVYGAKSANGVISITTKKGSMGKPVVNFQANVGIVTAPRTPSVLDADGYMSFRTDYEMGQVSSDYLSTYPEIFSNPNSLSGVDQLTWYNYDKSTPVSSVTQEELLRTYASRLDLKGPEIENYVNGIITDWTDLVFQVGLQQDYTASISNRNEQSSYYWSLGYADREGVVVGDDYQTFRTRLNLESKVTDFLTIGMNAGFSSRDESSIAVDWGAIVDLGPYTSNEIGNDESTYQRLANGETVCVNPLYDPMYQDRKTMYTTLNATMYADVKLPFDIKYRMNFTPYMQFYEYYYHQSSEGENYSSTGGSSTRTTSKTFNWQVDNIFSWEKTINEKHNLNATFLINAEQSQYWSQTAKNSAYSPNDLLGYHNLGGGTSPTVSSSDTYATGDALMGRLFYSYDQKYMVTASVRRDGYSAFGSYNPHAIFPSIALGWEFTRESFAEGLDSWLNYGKLRASWGENGNRDIGQYAALARMTSSTTPLIDASGNYYVTSQLYASQMSNDALSWERTASYNFGLDFRMFNNRVSGSLEYYTAKTNDLLVSRALPDITGFSSVTANLGQIQNNGFEVNLNAIAMDKRNFTWNVGLTFATNRTRINALYGDMEYIYDDEGNIIGETEANDYDNGWFIGQDPNVIWAYERDGVWQLGEEEEAAVYGCAPGDFRYIDQNGDGVMTNDDKEFLGQTTPKYSWTLTNSFTIMRNLNVSFSLYSYGGHLTDFNEASNAMSNTFPDRQSSYDIPRWTEDNPEEDYARISSYNIGTNYIKNTFVRLENVTVSYNLPKSVIQKFSIQNMGVSFSVRNASFWSPTNKYFDPETGTLSPMTLNLGLNLTL